MMTNYEWQTLCDTLFDNALRDKLHINSVMPTNYEFIKQQISQQQADTRRLLMRNTLEDVSNAKNISDGLKARTDGSSNPFTSNF